MAIDSEELLAVLARIPPAQRWVHGIGADGRVRTYGDDQHTSISDEAREAYHRLTCDCQRGMTARAAGPLPPKASGAPRA